MVDVVAKGILNLSIILNTTARDSTIADSDTVNIRKLILIPTVNLGVLEPLHRHAR